MRPTVLTTLTSAMLLAGTSALARTPKVFQEVEGTVSMEAENATNLDGWAEVAGKSGVAFEDEGGAMQYEVTFSQAGRFYVYLLASYTGDSSGERNDAYLTLDGERLYGVDDVTRPEGMRVHCSYDGGNGLCWTFFPKGPGGHTPDNIKNEPVYFQVDAPGTQLFEIASRSVGFVVDKIVFKLEGHDQKPEGLGPQETAIVDPVDDPMSGKGGAAGDAGVSGAAGVDSVLPTEGGTGGNKVMLSAGAGGVDPAMAGEAVLPTAGMPGSNMAPQSGSTAGCEVARRDTEGARLGTLLLAVSLLWRRRARVAG